MAMLRRPGEMPERIYRQNIFQLLYSHRIIYIFHKKKAKSTRFRANKQKSGKYFENKNKPLPLHRNQQDRFGV
jgi:hypothetical protein